MQHHMHAKGLVERSQKRSAADLISTIKQFEDEEKEDHFDNNVDGYNDTCQ